MANQFKVRKGLIVNGSGSTLLDVQGSQGQLFSITDSLSGSLFAVKDISGIPVMEAFSDNRVNIGTFNAEAIKVSGSFAFLTGSLRGTASWAQNAVTASYVLGGASTVNVQDEGGAAFSAGTLNFVGAGVTAADAGGGTATITIPGAGGTTFPFTGSAIISGSLLVTGSVSATQGGFTGSLQGTASWAQNSVTASFVPSTGVVGDFSRIATGSVTASVDIGSTAFQINNGSSTLLSVSSSGNTTLFASASDGLGTLLTLRSNIPFAGINLVGTDRSAIVTNSVRGVGILVRGIDLAKNASNTINASSVIRFSDDSVVSLYGYIGQLSTTQFGITSNNDLHLQTNQTSSITISSASGFVAVGVNYTAPSFSLDVSGSGRYTNGLQVTGSLNAPIITGSLFGTASWALNAVTTSYAVNMIVSGGLTDVDFIQFDTSSTAAIQDARLKWDDGEGTLQLGLKGNVDANIGEQLYQYVYNAEATTLTKATVVYVSGSQGGRIAVKRASATAEGLSAETLGLAAEDIAPGAEGWVITDGSLRGVNTAGLIGGQLIFLSSSAGEYTQTYPQAPLHGVRLGYVQKVDANPTQGILYIKIDNGYELDELHDVRITNASTGELLVRSGSVWVNTKQMTGSYTVTGSVALTDWLELAPGRDPGTANVSSSYFFVTSSSDNTEFNLHYRNNGALWETHWLEERTDTGIVWGGVLTFTSTTMSITPGAGLIVNHNASTSSHGDTTATYVPFGPITASAQFITSSQVTYLLIDENGQLVQQTTKFTPEQYNEKMPLGYIFCLTTSSISSYADARVTTYGQSEQGSEFIRAFGPLKLSGYDVTAQSGSLKVSIASGQSYRYGGFYSQNPDSPSLYDSTAVPTGSLVRIYRDPAVVGGFRAATNAGVPYTDIDPTKWDDGSGTLQTVASGEWTIQRIFQGVVNNVSYVYYGQNTYTSLTLALQSIATDPFEESPTSILALPFIGYVIAKGDATNLADTANNRIIQAGLFRNTAGSSGGGGAAAQSLDDLSDVTITSAINGQALVYSSGLWINGTPATASFAQTASFVALAQTASFVTTAQTASFVQTAQTASFVTLAQTASFVATASWARNAITASYVTGSIFTSTNPALSASYALTASYALSGGSGGSGLATKAGSIANTSFTGNPRKAIVTFSTPFANTSYGVVITGEDARTWTIEGKLTAGFTASANSNTGLAGTTYWIATAYGETT